MAYEPGKPVLHDVDLSVRPGERVAIVGPTGAGKSTIAKLIARHYDVSEGAVCVDGHDVREVKLASLRRQLGVVPQEPLPLRRHASPTTSASAGRRPATRRCARRPGWRGPTTSSRRCPRAYDTWVQEGAVNVSLGQRAAGLPGAGDAGPAARHHPRRGDLQRRHRHRAADPGGAGRAHGRAHLPSSSPTGWPPSARWTASSSCDGGAHRRAGQRTRSCWRAGGLYSRLYRTQTGMYGGPMNLVQRVH